EEQLVLQDRAAEVETILVAIQRRLLERCRNAGAANGERLEEAWCIQRSVAEELVQSRVEFAGTAVRCNVDGRARRAAVLCRLVIRYDLKLRYGVRRNGNQLIVKALVALAVGVIVEAVEQEVVEHAALAVDVVRAG